MPVENGLHIKGFETPLLIPNLISAAAIYSSAISLLSMLIKELVIRTIYCNSHRVMFWAQPSSTKTIWESLLLWPMWESKLDTWMFISSLSETGLRRSIWSSNSRSIMSWLLLTWWPSQWQVPYLFDYAPWCLESSFYWRMVIVASCQVWGVLDLMS